MLPSVAINGTSFLCTAINGASVILAVIPAVPFLAEEWVLEDVDIDEVYASSWYKLDIFVHGVRQVMDEGCEVKCFA